MPKSALHPRGFFDRDLIQTIKREILEETGLSPRWRQKIPVLISEELKTGFIQVVFLGLSVEADDLCNLLPNWEGKGIERIPFGDLKNCLLDPDNLAASGWTPTGMVHVLSWLALGAPNCNPEIRFGEFAAFELFHHIMSHFMGMRLEDRRVFFDL